MFPTLIETWEPRFFHFRNRLAFIIWAYLWRWRSTQITHIHDWKDDSNKPFVPHEITTDCNWASGQINILCTEPWKLPQCLHRVALKSSQQFALVRCWYAERSSWFELVFVKSKFHLTNTSGTCTLTHPKINSVIKPDLFQSDTRRTC